MTLEPGWLALDVDEPTGCADDRLSPAFVAEIGKVLDALDGEGAPECSKT